MLKPFFFHLIPLLYIGSKRRLTLDDLGDVPVHLLAIPTRKRLEDALAKGDPTSPGYLFRATLRGFGGSFGGPIIPRLILLLATYGQVVSLSSSGTRGDRLRTTDAHRTVACSSSSRT